MTTIASSLNTNSRGCFASVNGLIYWTNNHDPVKRWNGVTTTTEDAGIAGPAAAIGSPTTAAGNTSNGAHRIRYRYKDSRTGYVSNPSPEATVTVSGGNGALTYGIGAADDIVTTTDAKVDTIVVEMTAVNGQTFHQAGTALESASSIVINIADSSLIQQANSDDLYGSSESLDVYSHEVPPVGTILVHHRGRLWVMGDEAISISGTFTNASASVTGTGFSTKWAGRKLRISGATVEYIISSSTATTITLTANWSGTSGTYTASVYSATPNRGYYSRLGYPESFYTSVWARDLLPSHGDKLVGAWSMRDALYVFGKFSSDRVLINVDPAADRAPIVPIPGNRGVLNQRCLIEVEGRLFAFDRNGIYRVGEVPEHLSGPVDKALDELVDYSASAKFHAAFDPRERVLMFFYVATGDTQPKYAVCMELDTGKWFFEHFLQGITAAAIVPTSDGQVRLMLGDENGYSWFFGTEGSWDGVPPTAPSVVTTAGTPTTTVIDTVEALPTTSPTLAGVVAYNPANGQTSVISSNGANQITVAGFTTAPTTATELYLGVIPWEWRSKWLAPAGQEDRQRPMYLYLKLYPGSATGELLVYFYKDFQTQPAVFTALDTDFHNDGVHITNGDAFATIDLDGGSGDGFVAVPLPADHARVWQVRLVSTRPDGELRILECSLRISPKDTAEAPNE